HRGGCHGITGWTDRWGRRSGDGLGGERTDRETRWSAGNRFAASTERPRRHSEVVGRNGSQPADLRESGSSDLRVGPDQGARCEIRRGSERCRAAHFAVTTASDRQAHTGRQSAPDLKLYGAAAASTAGAQGRLYDEICNDPGCDTIALWRRHGCARRNGAAAENEELQCRSQGEEPVGRRSQAVHEELSQLRGGATEQPQQPAGEDEVLQRRREGQGPQGHCSQTVHERLPESSLRLETRSRLPPAKSPPGQGSFDTTNAGEGMVN